MDKDMGELKEFIPCEKCKDSKGTPKGYYWGPPTVYTTRNLIKCSCREEYEFYVKLFDCLIKKGFSSDIIDYDINKDYKGTKSSNELEKISTYIMGFVGDNELYRPLKENYRGAIVYIWGQMGTQKTHLVQYIGKELIKEGFDCQYVTIYQLIDAVAQVIKSSDENEEDFRKKYLNCDLLIIDELGNNYTTKSKFEIPYLDSFVRERINLGKGIIFVANKGLNDPDLKEKLNEGLFDFIYRNVYLNKSALEMKDVYLQNVDVYDSAEGLFSKPIGR